MDSTRKHSMDGAADDAHSLPTSFVPPVVAVLSEMAAHSDAMVRAAELSPFPTLDRAFEVHVNYAFRIMGFHTTLLGLGKGRSPDGIALFHGSSYGIVWDAKVRKDGYRLRTDDRTIREYIDTQQNKLRRFGLTNIYYAIVSSHFPSVSPDAVDQLRMQTGVSSVCFLQADALTAMVEARVMHGEEVPLGSLGIQRLFAQGGVTTPKLVDTLVSECDVESYS